MLNGSVHPQVVVSVIPVRNCARYRDAHGNVVLLVGPAQGVVGISLAVVVKSFGIAEYDYVFIAFPGFPIECVTIWIGVEGNNDVVSGTGLVIVEVYAVAGIFYVSA